MIDRLHEKCCDLASYYSKDIDGNDLYEEIKDYAMLFSEKLDTDLTTPKEPTDLIKLIIPYGDDVFPNLRIALQIMCTIGVSSASCERSFSKLKLILTYLRASMSETRLSDLAILSRKANSGINCL